MFYNEDEVYEHIKCPYCKLKYQDPRIVDCGASFCMSCIDLLIKIDEDGFNCPACTKFHLKPANGFLKNVNLAKLCDINATVVSRGPLVESFKTVLDEIKSKLDELNSNNKLGVDKIRDYCDKLRNDVQLHAEELIEAIKKQNIELIQQIDAYEQESTLNFSQENSTKLSKFINETYAMHSNWSKLLKQQKISDTELKSATAEAKKSLSRVKQEDGMFLNELFGDKLFIFLKESSQVESELVGRLVVDYQTPCKSLKKYDLCGINPGMNKDEIEGPLAVKFLFNDLIITN